MSQEVFFLLTRDTETGQRNVTVFLPGARVETADDTHPNFNTILEEVTSGEPREDLIDLFDVGATVATRFKPVSERVSVANGHVFFDGDEVDNSLTKQIVRFLDEGVTDWGPLVNFMEKVAANPNEHSREQLYEWLSRHDFTIDYSGDLIAYKGVASDGNGGYQSLHSGYGIVNGEVFQNSRIPNAVGDVIEIPRSMVHADPSIGCSIGMHVGTHAYAKGYSSGGVLLKVAVNPRDVVSVPTDCNAQKVRVCRYEVLDVIQERIESPIDPASIPQFEALDDEYYEDEDEYYEDEDYCEVCGGPCEDGY